jgi:anti-sigma factor (TIGR02949 family)
MSGGKIPALPPECVDVLQHVWDYLDHQLTPEATERLSTHLASCPQCFEYKTFQENFLDALRAIRDRPGASPELRDKVIESLRAEGFAR